MQLPSIRMFLNLIVFFLNSLYSFEVVKFYGNLKQYFLNSLYSFEEE